MDFDYDSLVALAAVVREGSFDGASRALNVTQSAVSQRIKQLEDRVGSVLIVRGRPCVPTETGLQLCQHVEQVTLLQHELRDKIATITGEAATEAATVRIGVNSDSLATWFPNVVRRAADELNIRFEIISDDQDYTEQSLKSGDALAIVTTNEKPIQGCRRVSLGAMEYLAVASAEFAEKRLPKKPTLLSLSEAPVLLFDRKDTLPEQWMLQSFGERANTNGHMMPSYEGYMACCLNGSGWGMMPIDTVGPYLANGQLIEIVPGKRVLISLHWQTSNQSSEILRLLSELVADVAGARLLPDAFRPA